MNIMRKENEQGKYTVTLENGTVYHGVTALCAAYADEREAMHCIFDEIIGVNGGISNRHLTETAFGRGVLFFCKDDPDKFRYVFVKGKKNKAPIVEYVFELVEKGGETSRDIQLIARIEEELMGTRRYMSCYHTRRHILDYLREAHRCDATWEEYVEYYLPEISECTCLAGTCYWPPERVIKTLEKQGLLSAFKQYLK